MKLKRDAAWLKKTVNQEFAIFIGGAQDHEDTLKEEIQQLFPQSHLVTKEAANFVMEIAEAEVSGAEAYRITKNQEQILLQGSDYPGLLHGFFQIYFKLVTQQEIKNETVVPQQHLRMINQWDNADGSVERGYAGESIFYHNGQFRRDDELVKEYARLLASVGINGISINNVNVHAIETKFITPEYLPDVKRVADIFAAYGITTYLSLNYAAPVELGGLSTADPLAEEVIAFWQNTVAAIYQVIPNFGGFIVKADSENRPGPFTYGRNHDEGANVLGRALKPYGGKVIWRCFVYNCKQDWRDHSIDRARAAFDNFKPLDGKFEDNVILQIKNGPIDFQVREAVSPLFGQLQKTNQILEFQIAQEYTGQQKHICYLLPMWKEVLDFETYADKEAPVKKVLGHFSPVPENSGIAAVANIGFDDNWTGHKLAQANLFGYGLLIGANDLSAEAIAKLWIALTFDLSPQNQEALLDILMTSRQTYENYTAPLGVGFMVEPNHHYGPNVDGYEYAAWGTYHYADRNGIGVDRTAKTGTGYVKQYLGENVAQYENLATCPDNLILFFHHVDYTHVLHSGQTVIQHIYDTHFAGYETAEEYARTWERFKEEMDPTAFANVQERLQEQLRCGREWRDQINTYFYRKSGISDEQGRKIY